MSLFYGGGCKKISEDDEFVLYEYFCFNLAVDYRKKIFDVIILIKKSCLLEPEYSKKFRRMPSGRRRELTKIIIREVDIGKLIESGDVQIENCSRAWRILPIGVDYIAFYLCRKIFLDYRREGILPEKCGYFV